MEQGVAVEKERSDQICDIFWRTGRQEFLMERKVQRRPCGGLFAAESIHALSSGSFHDQNP